MQEQKNNFTTSEANTNLRAARADERAVCFAVPASRAVPADYMQKGRVEQQQQQQQTQEVKNLLKPL